MIQPYSLKLFILITLALNTGVSFASSPDPSTASEPQPLTAEGNVEFSEKTSPQRIEQIATDKQWLHLLHYHQVGFFGHGESQADDAAFFLSASGKVDPKAELIANLNSLPLNHNNSQCKFPARTQWLKQKFPSLTFVTASCPEFEKWRDEINAESLSLIFPAAYLNSPSSMFGHTLMRIDSATHDNALLDYSVNYAANADPDDNELVFTYKGLSGGYPGLFSVLPYYEKVKEYSFLEARDVWEYELDVTPDELNQFIRHVWELKDIKFDYYFFTENCSYHLLTLLDGASERFSFSEHFTTDVIPSDTVRVLNREGIIKRAEFRPSTLSAMRNMKAQMSDAQQKAALTLVENEISKQEIPKLIEHFSETEKSQILELAYRYSRYQSLNNDGDSKRLAKTSLNLLSSRSKLQQGVMFTPHPTPKVRDDQGHFSHRHQFSTGQQGDSVFLDYGLRMSYHDWLDNIDGYLRGAQLQLGELKFRYLIEDSADKSADLRIEKLGLIDIASLSGRDSFFQPLSWFVSTGFDRPRYAEETFLPFLRGGAGYSYQTEYQTISVLLNHDLQLSKHQDKGHHFGIGPRFVWLYQASAVNVTLDALREIDISGAKYDRSEYALGISKPVSSGWQLRLEGAYSEFEDRFDQDHYESRWTLSVMNYF